MTTPLERAEQAVAEAWATARLILTGGVPWSAKTAEVNLDALIAAAEARYEARLREAANSPSLDDHTRKAGHFLADVVAGWPTGSRLRFGPGEGLDASADACQLHSTTGVPCDCGHDSAADCHPGARRAT